MFTDWTINHKAAAANEFVCESKFEAFLPSMRAGYVMDQSLFIAGINLESEKGHDRLDK
jgi:hypothetical protein